MNNIDFEREKFFQYEMSCVIMNKQLEELKPYFIASDITNNNLIYSDIQHNLNNALKIACYNGKFSLIKYVLTSPELSMHADIHYNNNISIYCTSIGCYTNITKYLLTSEQLKEKANLYSIDKDNGILINDIFEELLSNKLIKENDEYGSVEADEDAIDMINYFIYDYCVSPTEEIINELKKQTDKSFYEPVIKQLNTNALFNKLNESIEKSLHNNLNKIKKDKKIKV